MDARFCAACGHALEEFDDAGWPRQRCTACGRVRYVNPKAAVGALVVRDGHLLLSRRARPPHEGEWDLPGGFLESGEHPVDGLVRELAEETRCRATIGRLVHVGVGTYGSADTLNLVYVAELDGEPQPQDDSLDMRWFPLDDLPPVAFPHEREAVEAYRAGRAPSGS